MKYDFQDRFVITGEGNNIKAHFRGNHKNISRFMPRILRSHSTGGSGGENTTSFTSSLETATNNNTTNNNMNNNSAAYNKYIIFDTSPIIYTSTSTTTNTNTEPYTPYISSLSPLNIPPPPPPQTSPIYSISTDSFLEEEKGRENSRDNIRESGRDKMFRSLGILSATSSTSVVYDKDMMLAPSASVGGAVVGPPRLSLRQSSDSTPVYTYAGDGKWLIGLFVCARCCLLLFIAHVVHVLYKCTFTHHIHYMAFLHQYITY